MIIKMSTNATEAQIQHIVRRIQDCGCRAQLIRGVENTVVGVIGNSNQHRNQLEALAVAPGVDEIIPVAHPFKLVSLQFRGERTVVDVAGVRIGGGEAIIIAGPCSVESRDQLLQTARAVKASGAHMLRGGAYKPRTSPYDFQGLGVEALGILREARAETGLPVVTEVMGTEEIDLVSEYADMLQVGARNMQNYPLLRRLAGLTKPIRSNARLRLLSRNGCWQPSTCSPEETRTWSFANVESRRSSLSCATRLTWRAWLWQRSFRTCPSSSIRRTPPAGAA